MSTLVTGGAGYIGSHVVRLLRARGDDVVVIDDLSGGRTARADDGPVISIDLVADAGASQLAEVIAAQDVTAVIHLAARKQAGESVERPAYYFRQNVGGLANVLSALEGSQVSRFVFSSSAAVYGESAAELVDEQTATAPANPYGETKLAGEWLVRDEARARGLSAVSLRYFNVAGTGWPDLYDSAPLNLLTIAIDAVSRGETPQIFGDDYPTPDGTGVRDYVHVLDLARAHLAALDAEVEPRQHRVFNVGTGHGASVREILDELARASGIPFESEVIARRPGDPASVVADAGRISRELGWNAQLTVADMVESAWRAHRAAKRSHTTPSS